MDRDAERKAFSRAWGYLNYSAAATWTALLFAAIHAFLYVVLLVLFWLFADLIVNRGEIPRLSETPAETREFLLGDWRTGLQWDKTWLSGILKDDRIAHLQKENLRVREQELLWRIYLVGLLREQVSGMAAATVLPAYHELPQREQEGLKEYWKEKAAGEIKLPADFSQNWDIVARDQRPWAWMMRSQYHFSPEWIEHLMRGTDSLSEPELDIVWHIYLDLFFRYTDPKLGSESYRREAFAIHTALETHLKLAAAALGDTVDSESAANFLATASEESTLANRGILSLVVRTHLERRAVSRFFGFIAVPDFYGSFPLYLFSLLSIGVIVAMLRAAFGYLNHELAAVAAVEASTRLRRVVYHHTYRLGNLAIRELGPSEAVSIYTRQVEAVHDGLYACLTGYFREAVKFFLLLGFAMFVDYLLGLAFIFFAVLVWAVGGQLADYFQRRGRASSNRAAEQLTLIRESLMLMRLVKVYLMELFNQARVERLLARYAGLQQRRYRGEAIYDSSLVLMGSLCIMLLMFVAGFIVLHGRIGNAAIIALAATLVSLYFPLVIWRDQRRIVRRAREASVAVFGFLDRPADIKSDARAEFLQPLSHSLEFDNVTLKEPGTNRLLLKDVTLKIRAGQRVGVIGVEESEKHAFVYLIPRFLDPTSGEIRIDDNNLRFVTLDSLRAQIAVVMQHNLVFHDTVASNISCGDQAYTEPQIIEAAKLAHAHNFIQKLPQGYATAIGELGHSLSISQQFRIALARAILRDPALIIIEEPTTILDDDTKALIDDTYARLLPGRTVIFLPHRISTIRTCDQLFLIHRGELEAAATHRELLGKSPLYRHLHYIEFNEIAESA